MTDRPFRTVSLNKKPSDISRPSSVLALAMAMVISGLLAVVAALTLYGEHHYLVTSLAKNEPKQKLPTSSISTITDRTTDAFAGALTAGSTLDSSKISSVANSTADAFSAALSRDNATATQHSDQVTKVHDAAKSVLSTGTLSASRLSSDKADLDKQVRSDLQSLQKSQLSPSQVQSQANKIPSSQLIASIVLTVFLAFVAFGAYAGRYWARWAVPVLWVLCSFTGTSAGLVSLLQFKSDVPAAYKLTSALSAALLLIAVILSFIRPSKLWWEAHRPAPPAGGARRGGLFAPRVPPVDARGSAKSTSRATTPDRPVRTSGADRTRTNARTKKRVGAEATRNGAELARSRAKTAAKSRRTEGDRA